MDVGLWGWGMGFWGRRVTVKQLLADVHYPSILQIMAIMAPFYQLGAQRSQIEGRSHHPPILDRRVIT
jgi:hypothetical protein